MYGPVGVAASLRPDSVRILPEEEEDEDEEGLEDCAYAATANMQLYERNWENMAAIEPLSARKEAKQCD